MGVVIDVNLRLDALRSFASLLAKDMREEYVMMIEEEGSRIEATISDDDDDDEEDEEEEEDCDHDCYDDGNDDEDGDIGNCRERDGGHGIIIDDGHVAADDDDDDDISLKYSSKYGRSIVGLKRRNTCHNEDKHIQSIITETKRKGTELEGAELLSSMMMVDRARSDNTNNGGGGGVEGGNQRSVASKRAKLIFGSSLQSKASLITKLPPTRILTNNNNQDNKSNKNIRHNSMSSTETGVLKSTSTTHKPKSLLDIDRLASSALYPPSKSSLSSSSSAAATASQSSIQVNRFKCGVCTEQPSLPCAGRCGHICCQLCWVKWLQINATCPMCRAPADKNSVTRLIMKG